ncbi:peroxiredoxin [bacterium]|nr:peroxiredoxin [bacterium]
MSFLKTVIKASLIFTFCGFSARGHAAELKVGDPAPSVSLVAHDGSSFSLESRKGKGWTILYFYPKAGTPGCTKQACAFRDAADEIRKQNTEIFGVSTDTVDKLSAFHKEHNLSFKLLADPDAKTTDAFGVKIPVVKIAKRWTFVIDPELKVRHINDKVDPLLDAKQMIEVVKKLSGKSESTKK